MAKKLVIAGACVSFAERHLQLEMHLLGTSDLPKEVLKKLNTECDLSTKMWFHLCNGSITNLWQNLHQYCSKINMHAPTVVPVLCNNNQTGFQTF